LPQEQAIGRAAADEFSKRVTLLRTPAVADYLTQLGKDLSAAAPGAQYPYTFTAFRGYAAIPTNDAGVMEAITLPGGPVFLSIDLIGKLDGESELAAVLAHAVAHVALRHSTRTATREEIVEMAARTAPSGVAPMISIGFHKFARGYEMQADALAVRIMAEAGYDPVGLLNYLRKLPPLPQIDRANSSVPAPQTRMQVVEDAIRALPQTTYRPDSGQFALWKRAVGTPDSQ
jgi:predicted Zn-dependent protease